MAEIDRRTMLRGVLLGAAFITAGGVAVTSAPDLAEAVPLAADKTGPVETDDLFEDQERVQLAQYYWRRRRRRWWWWHRRRRRWACWWRRGRRVCARRW